MSIYVDARTLCLFILLVGFVVLAFVFVLLCFALLCICADHARTKSCPINVNKIVTNNFWYSRLARNVVGFIIIIVRHHCEYQIFPRNSSKKSRKQKNYSRHFYIPFFHVILCFVSILIKCFLNCRRSMRNERKYSYLNVG